MKKNIVINILLIIFICIFIYSGYNIFMWLKSDRETKALEEGLYLNVVTEVKNNEESEEENVVNEEQIQELQVDFDELKSINEDIFAWIKIDDTYINYPILKGESDEYYLKRDIYKKYSVSGSIFVDSSTNTNLEDDNTVIYGHNMKNERMFANLHKINNGILGNDVTVQILLPERNIKYKVFASYILEPNSDIIKKNFESKEEKQNYIDTAIKRSNIKYDIDNINYDNNIITLITCDNNNKRRVIVHAIEIK